MNDLFPPPEFPTMYRSVGLVYGEYLPSKDSSDYGMLLTTDGMYYPSLLIPRLRKEIKVKPNKFTGQQIWVVWPKTQKNSPKLKFRLVYPDRKIYNSLPQTLLPESINYFSVRGVVSWQRDGYLGVRVERNSTPPIGKEQSPLWRPFFIQVDGSLPVKAKGQFWELDLSREGDKLVIQEAQLIQKKPNYREESFLTNSDSQLTLHLPQKYDVPQLSLV
jgi:hypothetical protein